MDPLLLRFFERITVVLIGGLAVYLGFRLFLAVPEHKDSAGKLVLPWDITIVMTRIGPGVFFALFGVAAVGLSLIRPMEITSQRPGPSGDKGGNLSITYAGSSALGDRTVRADARALLRKDIAVLNTIPSLLNTELPEQDRYSVELSIRNVKLALLKPVWGDPSEGFGDFSEFESWVRAGESDPPPANIEEALALFRYGLKETRP